MNDEDNATLENLKFRLSIAEGRYESTRKQLHADRVERLKEAIHFIGETK